ncbi:ankyrin repeat-containing protein BDA1-like [Rhododendron vialii]|uniref:ankyrin repeat-containing protein BDA1-like n=1 Tax=Rhododendron vialii TaxID=182163 RepID=UPI00265EF3AF|nr:ankyrin repeat-containing protein BDA1-like [Rhododendron vialii]
MEELLCDAAMRGDLESLHEIIAKDNYILDKVLVGSFKGKNPLHVSTSIGQLEFVLKLLEIKPKLAKVLDTELGAALHIASANGDVKIVEALVGLSPEMCMARNRDGNNPLHIAAMEGKVDVLKKLVETCPLAAQVILDRGDTILHLCVKYNQLECLQLLLEMIRDPEFVQSKDANGNSMLHIAVFSKRFEIVEHVLNSTRIDVDATNGAGWTAMDIYFFVQNRSNGHEVDVRIEKFLRTARARRRREMLVFTSQSQEKLMQTVMVVSSLFATMAFQVGVNPPGGVWQDNFKEHIAGKAMLAYKYPNSYACFMFFNTVGFLLSLFLILSILATAVPVTRNPRGLLLPVIS